MSEGRGRIAFAAGAAAVLIAVVVAMAAGGSSGGDDRPDDECLAIWNDDPVARSDGTHAYSVHGYRETLLTRVDADGEAVSEPAGEPSPAERCAVIFASPQVDDEPDFGVRVLDDGRWAGLALVDKLPLEQIAELQGEATSTANHTLLPDGRLAAD